MKAIDVHTHIHAMIGYTRAVGPKFAEFASKYYGVEDKIMTEEEVVKIYRDLDVKALIVGQDWEAGLGVPKIDNAYPAGLVKKYPDVFIGAWAVIDPWKGKSAIVELERCVKELGMLGVKFQPLMQAFFPNDQQFYPFYERCSELGVPVSFHTGSTGAGAGMPGGGGIHLKFSRPIPYIDDLAADFPNLKIIMIHPSVPWPDEQIAVLVHKGNVFADLAGYAPKYWPEPIKREVGGRLQDKFMFASDFPEVSPKRWIDEFEAAGYKPAVVDKVLYKNAQRILGVGLE